MNTRSDLLITVLLVSAWYASHVIATEEPAAVEASVDLDCDNNLVVNPPKGKNIHFGDDGKLTFDVNTGDIKSEQMAAMTTESARQADEIIMLKADNARQADTSARQADTIIMLEANAVLQAAEIASLKQGAGNQKDVVNESTGVVTASDAFCAAWGATMEIFTSKPGSCEFPTVWNADVDLEGWMVPLMKHVTIIIGYLKISNQHYLTSMSSILPNLEEVTDYVEISNCNGLVKDVAGFANLVKVGAYVKVDGNANLKVLDNQLFPSLTFVAGGGVTVRGNNKLTNMTNYLPLLENSTGTIIIDNNQKLATMANVCEALLTSGGVTIQNADELASFDSTSGFANLKTSSRQITIKNNDKMTTMTNVFASLVATAGVSIQDNNALTSLDRTFGKLATSTGPITISGNYILTIMTNVFESLVTTHGVLIKDSALTSLDSTSGFVNLATSTGVIYIGSNAELITINGMFPSLTVTFSWYQLSLVTYSLIIDDNPRLHTVGPIRIGASSSPMTLSATFRVSSNKLLADVSGLNGLECTATDSCAMNWYGNEKLDKTDVCDVWDSMTGTGPKKSNYDCDDGRNRPCWGPGTTGWQGIAANCN